MNTLVVFGATGQTGSSVVNHVLNSPLKNKYALRAITRDSSKPDAQAYITKGVEVVQADAEDASSLSAAVENAHTVFIVTATVYDEHLATREFRQGKAIADAAVAAGAKYLIFSSAVHTNDRVDVFESKVVLEKYIRSLPVASAFYSPGMFMQNLLTFMKPRPIESSVEEYSMVNVISPDAKIPLIDIVADTGKFVGAILSESERFAGKTLYAASQMRSLQEIAATFTEVTGKRVRYLQIPDKEFIKVLPEAMAERQVAMVRWFENPGYFGEKTEELVEESAKGLEGLKDLKVFLKENKALA
ncbi:hypothetical protein ASPWEDRAFT_164169 [Aspergillus wentii DTO 134E9]|uniref:NmrA-like domain-containing protein n=1 Tax=Aspergillus wentii DTO 134E9 TaxID=1073089 RepID=A0A1L9R5M7_ASPWE|nr:uncharacterized protein ASPWEDRAFT_164169 [Aspergillus wentii DTO 134E9]KAI9925287.1 NmrA-like domain-containing protein 1 [Aspergillus wentii]OJJ30215.1 hypothetical protein ASPWEDRAFT_164169 [Aspergillus wentii DTO 134E9]